MILFIIKPIDFNIISAFYIFRKMVKELTKGIITLIPIYVADKWPESRLEPQSHVIKLGPPDKVINLFSLVFEK